MAPSKKRKKVGSSDKNEEVELYSQRAAAQKADDDNGQDVAKLVQVLQAFDVIVCMMFLSLNTARYSDSSIAEAPPNYSNVIAFQMFCSLVAILFGLLSITLLLRAFSMPQPSLTHVLNVLVLKVITLFMDFIQTAYAGSNVMRTYMGTALWAIHTIEIIGLIFLGGKVAGKAIVHKGAKRVPPLMRALARIQTDRRITVSSAEKLEVWLRGSNTKRRQPLLLGTKIFTYLSFFIMFVVFGNFYSEFGKLGGAVDPMLPITGDVSSLQAVYEGTNLSEYWCSDGRWSVAEPPKAIDALSTQDELDAAAAATLASAVTYDFNYSASCFNQGLGSPGFDAESPCPHLATTNSTEGCSCSVRNLTSTCNRTLPSARQRTRVVLVCVDGLRADYAHPDTTPAAKWKEALAADWAGGFLFYKKMGAMLPTKTSPGWTSMLTGAEPEIHGVLGDAAPMETYLDSLYNQAQLQGVFAGISGTPWLAQSVRSKLPVPSGDITVPPGDRGEKAGDDTQFTYADALPAHARRSTVATQAARVLEPLELGIPAPVANATAPNSTVQPLYDLLMAQFSIVDSAAHSLLANRSGYLHTQKRHVVVGGVTGGYAGAVAACQGLGGLAVIHDALVAQDVGEACANATGGSSSCFIGLAQQASSGTFMWEDGTGVSFNGWAKGETADENQPITKGSKSGFVAVVAGVGEAVTVPPPSATGLTDTWYPWTAVEEGDAAVTVAVCGAYPSGSYTLAVEDAAASLKSIMIESRRVDAAYGTKTLVVVTSSHGVDDFGTNGGISEDERDVPLLVYSHNGGVPWADKEQLGEVGKANVAPLPPMHRGPECSSCLPGYVNDLAPTIAVMLGLPIPRQNQGRVLKEALGPIQFASTTSAASASSDARSGASPSLVAMHYRDHYSQYRAFVKAYLADIDYTLDGLQFPPHAARLRAVGQDTPLPKDEQLTMAGVGPDDTCATKPLACDYIDDDAPGKGAINARAALNARGIVWQNGLIAQFVEKRAKNIYFEKIRNYVIAFTILVIVLAVTLAVMQATTYADLLAPGEKDLVAIKYALSSVAFYYAFCIFTYWLFFYIWGFRCPTQGPAGAAGNATANPNYCVEWGARNFHSRGMLYQYAMALLVPGFISSYLIHRSVVYNYSRQPYVAHANRVQAFMRSVANVLMVCFNGESEPTDVALIYLIKIYLTFFSIIGAGVTLVMLSEFSFIMPFVFRIRNLSVLDPASAQFWDTRFRFVCMVGISLPLQWSNLISAALWSGQLMNKDLYEQMFRLMQEKGLRKVPQAVVEKLLLTVDPRRAEDEANQHLTLKDLSQVQSQLGSGPTVGTLDTVGELSRRVQELKDQHVLLNKHSKGQLSDANIEKELFAARCNADILSVREEMEIMRLHEKELMKEFTALHQGHIASQERHEFTNSRDTRMASVGEPELAAKVKRTERELLVVDAERKILRGDLSAVLASQHENSTLTKIMEELEEANDQARGDQKDLFRQVDTLTDELRDARVAKLQIQRQAEADKVMMEKLLTEFKTRLVTAETMFQQWDGAGDKV